MSREPDYDEVISGSPDDGKVVYIVHLGFGKVLNTVSDGILVAKLGLSEQGRWEKSWMGDQP